MIDWKARTISIAAPNQPISVSGECRAMVKNKEILDYIDGRELLVKFDSNTSILTDARTLHLLDVIVKLTPFYIFFRQLDRLKIGLLEKEELCEELFDSDLSIEHAAILFPLLALEMAFSACDICTIIKVLNCKRLVSVADSTKLLVLEDFLASGETSIRSYMSSKAFIVSTNQYNQLKAKTASLDENYRSFIMEKLVIDSSLPETEYVTDQDCKDCYEHYINILYPFPFMEDHVLKIN
jgi:hypothetical protein